MIRTLRGRMTLWFTLLFTVMSLTTFFYVHRVLVRDLNSRTIEQLVDNADEIVTFFDTAGLERAAAEIQLEVDGDDRRTVFYRIFSPEHETLATTDMRSWQQLPQRPEKVPLPGEIDFARLTIPGHEFDVNAIYHGMSGGYILQIGIESVENGRLLQLLNETFAVAFIILAASGVLLGSWLSKRSLMGIERLRESCERISEGDFSHPVEKGREGIEIESLIESFNRMQERIQSLVGELRQVTNDIAHDLRSPLTRIRGLSETTLTGPQRIDDYQDMTGSIIEESDKLVSMINTMLELAESDAGVTKINLNTVDVSTMIQDVGDLFLPVAEDKDIHLKIELPAEPISLTGDRGRLQRALANLVDNAVKYTPNGGTVRLSANPEINNIAITVSDTGPGIPEPDQSQVFDRFFRCDPSRTTAGNGLGLALVKSIVKLHHGTIRLDSKVGKGSSFMLLLPVDPP